VAALRAAPNMVILLTGAGFLARPDKLGDQLLRQRELLKLALGLGGTVNIIPVYGADFKVPQPSRVTPELRAILKHDFHKFDPADHVVRRVCAASINRHLVSEHGLLTDNELEWVTGPEAVNACMNTRETAQQLSCLEAFQHFATTVEGERGLYTQHAIAATAAALTQALQAGRDTGARAYLPALLRCAAGLARRSQALRARWHEVTTRAPPGQKSRAACLPSGLLDLKGCLVTAECALMTPTVRTVRVWRREAMRFCSVLAFNNFDLKDRIAAIAIEGGVAGFSAPLIPLLLLLLLPASSPDA
jgi:hypothetical protein